MTAAVSAHGIGAEMVLPGCASDWSRFSILAMQQAGAERFGEVGVGTYLVAFSCRAASLWLSAVYGVCGWCARLFQLTAHLVSVHYRHHFTDDDVGYFFQGLCPAFRWRQSLLKVSEKDRLYSRRCPDCLPPAIWVCRWMKLRFTLCLFYMLDVAFLFRESVCSACG